MPQKKKTIHKKHTKKYPPSSYTPPKPMHDESDGGSSGEEEDQEDYRPGGYYEVTIGDVFKDKYKIIKKLGWGQFSTVWLAKDLNILNRYYALKIQKGAQKYREAAEDEIELLDYTMNIRNKLNIDPPVLKLYDHFILRGPYGNHVCFVYELLGKNLLDLIQYYDYQGIPLEYVKILAKDMLEGLAFLHSNCGIIHTDLKPENILLSDPNPTIPEILPILQPPQTPQPQKNEEIETLKKELENPSLSSEERNKLKKKIKKKQKKIYTSNQNQIPAVYKVVNQYRFITYNFDYQPSEKIDYTLPKLVPCTYLYPEDDYYIKLYFLCPMEPLVKGLGNPHSFQDPSLSDSARWSFLMGDSKYEENSNMFNISGEGPDSHSRLHDLYSILTQTNDNRLSKQHFFWSLRFDGRYCFDVFNLLEHLVPNLCFLRFPNSSQILSARESVLLDNVRKEFMPPHNSLFKQKNIAYSAIYYDATQYSLYLHPLSERLQEWPTFQEITESHTSPRTIPEPFFPEGTPIHCKIADLGNSCFINKHFTKYIQTRQYRSPEAILCADYYPSTDVWSAACIIFELVTGDYLFNPKNPNVNRDSEHLALFEDLLGPMNRNMFSKVPDPFTFFDKNGHLRYRHRNNRMNISAILIDEYFIDPDEACMIEKLLLPMLQYDPKKRISAEECLKDPWFSSSTLNS